MMRAPLKEVIYELRNDLMELGVDKYDLLESMVNVIRGQAGGIFEVDSYYDKPGNESYKAQRIRAIAEAKRTLDLVLTHAKQEPVIDVATELETNAKLIEEKVRIASVAIDEAETIAKEHGIPFSSSANGVSNNFDPEDGWEHSAIC